MYRYFLLHKPYGVLSQFTHEGGHKSLADIEFEISLNDVKSVGRLDTDSEGLLLLTNDKRLNSEILSPERGHPRTYHAQVEGAPDFKDIRFLQNPIDLLKKLKAKNLQQDLCKADILIPAPGASLKEPPIRVRKTVPDSWISLSLTEGKNRQVRKMTAKAGFPTLRLIRVSIGPFKLDHLKSGEVREVYFEEIEKLLEL